MVGRLRDIMDTKQLCEICECYLPADPFENCGCASRQYPEFYCGEGAIIRKGDIVLSVEGEMKIIMTDPSDPKESLVLRDSSDLEKVGIRTDEDFDTLSNLGEDEFYLDQNPWFEVWDTKKGNYSEPIYTLDEAVALLIEWADNETERE